MVQKWPDVSHSFWWYFSNVQVGSHSSRRR